MWSKELNLMKRVIREAGAAVMCFYGTKNEVSAKDDLSPVSQADMASHAVIVQGLGASGKFVMSEEDLGGEQRLNQRELFIVDPLDGTKDFLQQTGDFSILMAFVVDAVPVAACVYRPVGDILWFAESGKGAWRIVERGNAERIHVSEYNEFPGMRILVSRNHLRQQELDLIDDLGIGDKIPMGSAGLKACAVAEGSAEIYINSSDKTGEWDICAGDLIVREAGGVVVDLNGDDFVYNREDYMNRQGFLVCSRKSSEILSAL